MEFDFGILGELALSGDEHPSPQIAAQAYGLELQKQKEISFAEWEKDMADYLKCLLGDIVCELQPSERDSAVRQEVVSRLSMLLNSSDTLRGATIAPFGSFESDFYTEWADLDLSLELPIGSELPETIGKSRKVKILKSFMKILMKEAAGHKVQFIPYARVPLLTFEDPRHNISCDISVDNGVAMVKSRLLRWISNMDSRCRDLIFLVKCWAKAHRINDPKTGTLNSFAICLLVIFHLQTRSPPVLPPLNAVLHEDIARKLSGRSSQISREEVLNTCWEKIELFIKKKYGAQNGSSLAQLFVSFFCQFSSVSRLWLEGLAACTFTGEWGDTTSTCRQWRSKHYVMVVEDPFDRSENCARSVQEYSLPGIIHALSSTAEAFKHPSVHPDFQALPEILFCWPTGSQKQGIRMWLSKLYSREGKFAQVQFFRRFPGEGSSSIKVVSCQSHRPMKTVDSRSQRNGIVQGRGINISNQCQLKRDLATNPVNPYFCVRENKFGDQVNEQLGASEGKSHQKVRNRKNKEFQVGDNGMHTVFSETSLLGGLNKDWKEDLSSNKTVFSAEMEEATGRTLRKGTRNASSPGAPHSGFSGRNRTGTEMTVDLFQQQDEEVVNTKNPLSRKHNGRRRRSILREQGAGSQEIIAPSLSDTRIPDHQTAELPFNPNDMQTVEGESGSRQGNTCRLLNKTSNDLCVGSNTKTNSFEGPEKKKEKVSSVRKGRVTNNLAHVNAEEGSKGHWGPTVQKGWGKPAEQMSRDRKWMQKMAQNEESKPVVVDEENSLHILTATSDHPTLVEGLQSMQVSDLQSRQNFERGKNLKNKSFKEQFWRPKCQE